MKINHEFVFQVMRYMAEEELYEDIQWTESLKFYVNCSDVFFWGCADAEDLTEDNFQLFVDTYNECIEALKDSEKNEYAYLNWAPVLFCARSRKMRPQGAFYENMPEELIPLFNECGEEREVNFGNPYTTPKTAGDKPVYAYQSEYVNQKISLANKLESVFNKFKGLFKSA
jgi:hypothetical protein